MTEPEDSGLLFGASDRVELIATIILSLAAILTAWAAFQSAKWSGEQAISYAKAGATRTESTRFDTRAGQRTGVDVSVFTSWLEAVNADIESGAVTLEPGRSYVPVDGTLSGFLYQRMRDEFRPAMDAWLELFINDRESAPPTPFAMDEYVVQDSIEADRLLAEAEAHAADAGQANQNSDDYVLTVVVYALVLFFGGVSSKLTEKRNRYIALGAAVILFVGASYVLYSLPRISPF